MRQHSTLREGIIAGLLAATVIAVWFLIIDTVSGRPLYTPAMLGTSLISVFGPAPPTDGTFLHIALYTVFHYLAFIGIGLLVAYLTHRSDQDPHVLIGMLILFVAFQVGWYGWTALLSQSQYYGAFAWWQVMAANLIAAFVMGSYFWRTHPQLRQSLAFALDGQERQ